MNAKDLLEYTLPALGTLICFIGSGVIQQLKRLNSNIQKLSLDMAIIAERVNHHEKRINRLENDHP